MTHTTMEKRQNRTPAEVERAETAPTYVPAVDIWETKEAFVLAADLPGVDEKNVDISLDRNTLTLRARTSATPTPGHSVLYQEYETGNYERSFTLGETIDRQAVQAAMRNGVLRLILPKVKAVQPRKIEVKTE
jgi:HSP20 family protein